MYYEVVFMIGRNTGRAAYLLRVLEIFKQCVLVPCDTLVNIGSGVLEAIDLSGLATEDPGYQLASSTQTMMVEPFLPMQVRPNFVGFTSTNSMALRTTRLEEGRTLGGVTYGQSGQPQFDREGL